MNPRPYCYPSPVPQPESIKSTRTWVCVLRFFAISSHPDQIVMSAMSRKRILQFHQAHPFRQSMKRLASMLWHIQWSQPNQCIQRICQRIQRICHWRLDLGLSRFGCIVGPRALSRSLHGREYLRMGRLWRYPSGRALVPAIWRGTGVPGRDDSMFSELTTDAYRMSRSAEGYLTDRLALSNASLVVGQHDQSEAARLVLQSGGELRISELRMGVGKDIDGVSTLVLQNGGSLSARQAVIGWQSAASITIQPGGISLSAAICALAAVTTQAVSF